MCHHNLLLVLTVCLVTAATAFAQPDQPAKGPVKIFLLSGQSNMTGRGTLGDLNRPGVEQPASLVNFIKDPMRADVEHHRFLYAGPNKTESGWTIRNDVFITIGDWPHLKPGEDGYDNARKHGGLGPYYGGRRMNGFGPELAIGHLLGDAYDQPVVLVKVAFGGNSLAGNFRPPSSGGKLGDKYPQIIKAYRDAVQHLSDIVPGYTQQQGHELVGLFWNQGLSDLNAERSQEYQANLVNLINDLREDLNAPRLLTVVAVTGNWGPGTKNYRAHLEAYARSRNTPIDQFMKERGSEMLTSLTTIRQAQRAVSKRPEFRGNVATAETCDFWRPREQFGGRGTWQHWNANGESYWLIGRAMGRQMLKLLARQAKEAAAVTDPAQPPFGFTHKTRFQGKFDMYSQGPHRIVVPDKVADGKPWVWRARFWAHEPQFDLAMLDKGYHVVYCDVIDLLGNAEAVERWNRFYKFLTEQHGFNAKPVLEGMSRGGMIVYNWAIANPDKVAAIYGDAPVMDLRSWPGAGSNMTRRAYKFRDADQARAYTGYPIDNLAPLAKAGVPIIHVVGDLDQTVPVAENTAIAEKRYKAMGGTIEVIHKQDCDHHPHSLKDPTPIVRFIEKHVERAAEGR
jgi:pimeloyl-ACP methyl ester carboxylesterase